MSRIDAEATYKTCTYTYKGCSVTFKLISVPGIDSKEEETWTIHSIPNINDAAECNAEDGVKAIAYNTLDAQFHSSDLDKAFTKVKNKLKDDECPEIRVTKKPEKRCTFEYIQPSKTQTPQVFKCYRLGLKAFKPGKCTNSKNYICLTNGEYEDGLSSNDLGGNGPGATANIDVLTGIGILDEDYTCEQLLGDDVVKLLEKIFVIIRILTPILLIVFTMIDYTKAIAAGEDEIKNATTKFIKRSIAAILIFLAPTLIEFIMDVTGISDGTCGLDY